MSRNKPKQQSTKTGDFDRARDELFQLIHRCGVLRATTDHQTEWMDETIDYLGEGYPSLNREQLGELRTMGLRFCRPVIDNVQVDAEGEAEVVGEPDDTSAAAA